MTHAILAVAAAVVFIYGPTVAAQSSDQEQSELEVRLLASGAALLDGNPADSLTLNDAVQRFVRTHPGGLIRYEMGVLYETGGSGNLPLFPDYDRHLSTIKNAVRAEWDRISRGKFKRPYSEATEEEQAIVRHITPFRIALTEPNRD